ncbi:YraN family protein [Corynebacterium epidermidicanis]|uniref:UPF0102 protein CEPID_07855 n=1 Tax=Corynebacterium epidermidicanis TaxID=1050174 RepID=A0A0G3GQD9_9CORY|nr:YraN family protein [Corynebacterium epidermidicanis]AKK03421.1 putative TIGR00252 family protein [Corynebacterium epidermidicanis]
MKRELGARGEALAAQYFVSRGGVILGRNVRYTCGELDLIVQLGGIIVFVEVKTRSTLDFGGAESITRAKFARMRRAAALWLEGQPYREVRFDALVLDFSADDPFFHYEGIVAGAR